MLQLGFQERDDHDRELQSFGFMDRHDGYSVPGRCRGRRFLVIIVAQEAEPFGIFGGGARLFLCKGKRQAAEFPIVRQFFRPIFLGSQLPFRLQLPFHQLHELRQVQQRASGLQPCQFPH